MRLISAHLRLATSFLHLFQADNDMKFVNSKYVLQSR